jgi:hypothetical protein
MNDVVRAFEAALLNPEAAQREVLTRLLTTNSQTEYGRLHGFAECRRYEDYAGRVPIVRYDDLGPHMERIIAGTPNVLISDEVVYLATSSGTTGRKKYVPIHCGFFDETQHWMTLEQHFLDRAHPQPEGLPTLRYVNRVEGTLPSQLPIGAVSGWYYGELSRRSQYAEIVPFEAFQLAPTVGRNYAVLRFALKERLCRLSAVNPSTLLLLAQRLVADAEALIRDVHDGGLRHPEVPKELSAPWAQLLPADPTRARHLEETFRREGTLSPRAAWPDLSLLCCWIHAGAGFYRSDLAHTFGPLPVWDYGYTSSEGRVTVTATKDGAGVPLITLVFIEVRAEDGTVRPLYALGDGEGGELLVSNSRGLYRYSMGDRVEVAGRIGQTPLIRFRGKTTAVASLTGEKLTEEQVVEAVERLLVEMGLRARFYCLAPVWGSPPRYHLLFEPVEPIDQNQGRILATALERALLERNSEYERKRETLRLAPLTVSLLQPGEYARYEAGLLQGGREVARLKIPRVTMDLELAGQFRGVVCEQIAPSA